MKHHKDFNLQLSPEKRICSFSTEVTNEGSMHPWQSERYKKGDMAQKKPYLYGHWRSQAPERKRFIYPLGLFMCSCTGIAPLKRKSDWVFYQYGTQGDPVRGGEHIVLVLSVNLVQVRTVWGNVSHRFHQLNVMTSDSRAQNLTFNGELWRITMRSPIQV